MRTSLPIGLLAVVSLLGCPGPNQAPPLPMTSGIEETDGGTAADESTSATSNSGGETPEDSSGSDSGDDSSDSGDPSGGQPPCVEAWQNTTCDQPGPYSGPGECDPFEQDCGAGYKCVPYTNVANETRCIPLATSVALVDEPCSITIVGDDLLDDCDVGLFCQVPVAGASEGTCVEQCGCGPDDTTCAADYTCVSADTVPGLHLCRRACDPLNDECLEGESCYPVASAGAIRGFACFPVGDQPEGSACPDGYGCAGGLICNEAICSPPCHIEIPASCVDGGTCTPYDPGDLDIPLCLANVGSCL